MSSIATLPRTGGNGAALVVVVADLLMDVYGALTAKSVHKVSATKVPALKVQVPEVKAAKELSVWQLYRLACNSDSVNPKILASLN